MRWVHGTSEAQATPGIAEGRRIYPPNSLDTEIEEVPVLFIQRLPPSEGNNSGFVFANRKNGPTPGEPTEIACLHCIVEHHPEVGFYVENLEIGWTAHRLSITSNWETAKPEES
jgi:hypothetical protein